MEKKFIYNNLSHSYHIEGNGQPVVLLHGFGEDSRIWDTQRDALKNEYKLIIPDLPGSGKSEMLSKENISIGDYAECLNALLDFENIDQLTLLGHSMGGYITLAFAEKYPERLQAFGLIHSTAFADSEEKKVTRRKGIEMINEYGVGPFLKNTTPNLFSKRFKQEHLEKVNELIEQGNDFTKEALIQYYNAMLNRSDRTSVLEKAPVPVLFVIGVEDIAAPLKDLLQQVHLPKLSYISIIEGAGHMSMMEESGKLNECLIGFLEFSTQKVLKIAV